MSKSLIKIGEMECYCCLKTVPLKQQANGYAIYKCDWCDIAVQAHGKESDERMRADADALAKSREPVPAIPAADPPPPAPVEKRDTRPAYLRS